MSPSCHLPVECHKRKKQTTIANCKSLLVYTVYTSGYNCLITV